MEMNIGLLGDQSYLNFAGFQEPLSDVSGDGGTLSILLPLHHCLIIHSVRALETSLPNNPNIIWLSEADQNSGTKGGSGL